MQHTFQVGDRVIVGDATKCHYSVPRCGESGVLKMVYEVGYEVALDKPELNRSEGIWYVSYGDLRHDTNFQVGDWVRHETVYTGTVMADEERFDKGMYQIAGTIGRDMVRVTKETQHKANTSGSLYAKNLVKIQPPQEEVMEEVPEINPEAEKYRDDAIERGIKEKIQLLERQV